jgi:hypothetical protein
MDPNLITRIADILLLLPVRDLTNEVADELRRREAAEAILAIPAIKTALLLRHWRPAYGTDRSEPCRWSVVFQGPDGVIRK